MRLMAQQNNSDNTGTQGTNEEGVDLKETGTSDDSSSENENNYAGS